MPLSGRQPAGERLGSWWGGQNREHRSALPKRDAGQLPRQLPNPPFRQPLGVQPCRVKKAIAIPPEASNAPQEKKEQELVPSGTRRIQRGNVQWTMYLWADNCLRGFLREENWRQISFTTSQFLSWRVTPHLPPPPEREGRKRRGWRMRKRREGPKNDESRSAALEMGRAQPERRAATATPSSSYSSSSSLGTCERAHPSLSRVIFFWHQNPPARWPVGQQQATSRLGRLASVLQSRQAGMRQPKNRNR